MELIEKLGTRKNKGGYTIASWGKFLCNHCNQEVEMQLNTGRKAESCNKCKYKLRSLKNKGKQFKKTIDYFNMQIENDILFKIGDVLFWNKKCLCGCNSFIKFRIDHKYINKSPNWLDGHMNRGENNFMYGKTHSEEYRFILSKRWEKENNPNWDNGSSFEPYSPEFNKDLKQQILERDNHTCQCPDCEHKSTKLDIHHIDYDKKNSNPENLITLCNSCHAKTNGKNKRNYFTEFYQNVMITKLVECLL